MVDYPYVECTSACVQALTMFAQHYPRHRATEITYISHHRLTASHSLPSLFHCYHQHCGEEGCGPDQEQAAPRWQLVRHRLILA